MNRAAEDGSLAREPVLVKALETAKTDGKKLHLMGLVSDGGVHSSHQASQRAFERCCRLWLTTGVRACLYRWP
ncbi:MAG: hypothetical protein U5L96_10265 [Owenweeksia sp.]|nr:hypothetical protein [Owenweeksia sp.]